MKIQHSAFLIGAALLAFSTANVQAQTAADASAPAAVSAAPASKKVMRQQNHALANRVRHALYKIKGLDAVDIAVFAMDGKVTLAGTVQEQEQIDTVGKVAAGVSGVTSVKNNVVLYEED